MTDLVSTATASGAALPSPAQLRGARAMLGWSMLQLAQVAHVSVSTIKHLERGEVQPLSFDLRTHVRAALEQAGVRFATDAAQGQGVYVARF